MDYLKKFFRDESASAEAASSAIMVGIASGLSGIWNSGFSGILDSLLDNPTVPLIVVGGLVLMMWMVYKA